jgi:membrane fusion protein (multidrug efflux system)
MTMTMRTKLPMRRGPFIVSGLLLLGAVACGRGDAPSGTTASATGMTIDVVRVVEQPLDVPLSLPAELAPYQSVAIYPKVTGFVKTMRVDRGSRVRAGDLIATLEAPELLAHRSEAQSKLQEAEAQLAAARSKADADRSTFDRLKAASATPGVVAGNDVLIAEKAAEASQNQVAAGQQNVEAARQAMTATRDLGEYLQVRAPFEGVITERDIHPGALVGPAGEASATVPMVRLVQNSRLRLIVPVPEAYTAAMKAGTEIPFSVAAYPGQTFSGTVARIAQAVDVRTRTMAVELDVMNKDGRLAPGTFCQVRWPVRRSGLSLFVPSGSLASTTARTFVVRIRNGKTEWVDVKKGLTSGPLVEVFGELRAGDEIASRGTDELPPGTEVRPRAAKPATS